MRVTNEVQTRGKLSGESVACNEPKVRRLSCVSFGKEKVRSGRCFKEGARWSSEDTTTRREKSQRDSQAISVVCLVHAWTNLQVSAPVAPALFCSEPSSVERRNNFVVVLCNGCDHSLLPTHISLLHQVLPALCASPRETCASQRDRRNS